MKGKSFRFDVAEKLNHAEVENFQKNRMEKSSAQ